MLNLFTDLVGLLLNKSGQDPTALHKLVSPRLALSLAFSADSPIKLGTFPPEDTLTILQAVKLFCEASRTLNLEWKPQFRHVEETSLVASSSRAIQEPTFEARTEVVESWTVQLEWNLVYEAPPVAMHAELATTKKRFKVWKSGPRTVNLVFASSSDGTAPVPPASDSESIGPSTSTELVTQATLAEAASTNGLQLVALEYSFETLPPPVAIWSFLGSATPLVLQCRTFKLFELILLTGLRVALSSWTALAGAVAPQQQAPQSTALLPDPEGVAPSIQLRHHQRHFEPKLQAEPIPTTTTDVIGTRRRWSVTSSSGGHGGQVAPSSFGTPATLSAAAHLHLERPLAERHLHGSAPGSGVPFGHEPAHAHPPRPHHLHHHQHQHLHHHRHSTDKYENGLVPRILSLPRQFFSMLFQILQIIIFDFLALGNVFGKMIEMILTYLQVSTTSTRIETTTPEEEEEGTPEGEEGPPPTGSTSSTKQVAFTQQATLDKPRSKRYSLPLNPPPSPHLSPIVEASSPLLDNNDKEGPALALPLPPLAPRTTPIPSGLVVPHSQSLQLPIPNDADSLAVALHEQLAHEAATQAQAQQQQQQQQQSERHKRRRSEFKFDFEQEEMLSSFTEEEEEQEEQNERGRREPSQVNPRTWMAHDLVAQEAASRARELEHVERMAERFAPGGPELGEFVEQASEEELAPREEEGVAAAAEDTPTPAAEDVESSSAPTETRPELRKTSSAPARSGHIPSPPPSSSASPSVAKVATHPSILLPPASITTSFAPSQQQQAGGESSLAVQFEQERVRLVPSSSAAVAAAESEALQDRLGLILYEPEPAPEPEVEAELEQGMGQEEGGGRGGGEGDGLLATSFSEPASTSPPSPPSASASAFASAPLAPADPAPSPSPATTTTSLTTPPPPPVLKTKKSFDPSERGIGIARAFGQGQGHGQGAIHPSASPLRSPDSSPTPTLGKAVTERAAEEEAATKLEIEQGPEAEAEAEFRRTAQPSGTGKSAHEEEEEEGGGGEPNRKREAAWRGTTQN